MGVYVYRCVLCVLCVYVDVHVCMYVCVCVCVQVCVLPVAYSHGGWARQPEGCTAVHGSEVPSEGGASRVDAR